MVGRLHGTTELVSGIACTTHDEHVVSPEWRGVRIGRVAGSRLPDGHSPRLPPLKLPHELCERTVATLSPSNAPALLLALRVPCTCPTTPLTRSVWRPTTGPHHSLPKSGKTAPASHTLAAKAPSATLKIVPPRGGSCAVGGWQAVTAPQKYPFCSHGPRHPPNRGGVLIATRRGTEWMTLRPGTHAQDAAVSIGDVDTQGAEEAVRTRSVCGAASPSLVFAQRPRNTQRGATQAHTVTTPQHLPLTAGPELDTSACVITSARRGVAWQLHCGTAAA